MANKLNNTQIDNMLKSLSRNRFRDRHSGVLKCLVDANSHKMAQKLYYDYISDSDFSKFPVFMAKLDHILYNMGGKKSKKPEIEEDEDIRLLKKKNKNK